MIERSIIDYRIEQSNNLIELFYEFIIDHSSLNYYPDKLNLLNFIYTSKII